MVDAPGMFAVGIRSTDAESLNITDKRCVQKHKYILITLIGISPRSSVTKEGKADKASFVEELKWIFKAKKRKQI